MRYPQPRGSQIMEPMGVRGSSPGVATWYWGVPDYTQRADTWPLTERGELLTVLQIESAEGVRNAEAIMTTPGVGAIFVGPADLSASMGHVGNAAHPDVQAAIEDGIVRILKAGKAPGILTPDETLAKHYLSLGAVFVAVGLDTQILMRQTTALAARFKAEVSAVAPAKGATY